MKYLLSVLLISFGFLSAGEPLNQMEYKITTVNSSYFKRDKVINITQDESIVGIVESYWSMVKSPNQATYVLKDANKKNILTAKAYRQFYEPFTLYFEITDMKGQVVGTIVLDYPDFTILGDNAPKNNTIYPSATIYSKEGVPLLKDKNELSFYAHFVTNIPGSDQKVSDLVSEALFSKEDWKLNIADLSYFADMEISSELFLFYMAIRSNHQDYSLASIKNVGYRY